VVVTWVIDIEIAAHGLASLAALLRRSSSMSSKESLARPTHPSTEDHDRPLDHDEHPHACNNGWVTIGQLVVNPETGEEREEFAQYLCRKCAERS
jgi:hypothetical protein